MAIGPKVSIAPPPPEHYLTHLPKHPGCAACMNCKVQRKHCRDQTKARQRKKSETIKIDVPHVDDEIEKGDAPKNFGELVTSDSIFAIKRNASQTRREGDTTALVVRDRASGWIATYPARRKSAQEIKSAVYDSEVSDPTHRGYSDGALELRDVYR